MMIFEEGKEGWAIFDSFNNLIVPTKGVCFYDPDLIEEGVYDEWFKDPEGIKVYAPFKNLKVFETELEAWENYKRFLSLSISCLEVKLIAAKGNIEFAINRIQELQ